MVKTDKNIVLIGFMASGKTLASRELAGRLKRERVSTDEMITEREGRTIREIFAQSGEPYFRQLEKKAVEEISQLRNLVIDCGGGIVMNEDSLNALKAGGIVFFLEASPEAIYRRTKGMRNRPLLNVDNPIEKIKELLALRDPHYRKAHHVVDSNSDNIGKVVDDILNILSRL